MSTQEGKQPEARNKSVPSADEAMKMLRDSGADDHVIAHCVAVSALALRIAKKCKKPVDAELVEVAGILHDIGRSKTHGITHAIVGARIAQDLELDKKIVNIIERHIGAGLSKEDAARLGLPSKDYLPVTIEEKIIAHADNLLSGDKKIPIAQTVARLVRKGEEEGAKRMLSLHKELSDFCGIDLDLL